MIGRLADVTDHYLRFGHVAFGADDPRVLRTASTSP
jgi:hypothetical protein